jgi:hypothetical protein
MKNGSVSRDISDKNLMKISESSENNTKNFQPKKLNLEMFRNAREKLNKMNREIQSLKEKVHTNNSIESN